MRRRRRSGIGVYATTGRLEKGYRAHGNELELDFDLVEAGMARPKVKDADFLGKAAYLEQRAQPPAAILCTLTVDDHTSSSGVEALHAGQGADPDARRRSRSSMPRAAARTSRAPGPGPSVGKHLLMSYLPPGTGGRRDASWRVEYFGERYPVTVAVAGEHAAVRPEQRAHPELGAPP